MEKKIFLKIKNASWQLWVLLALIFVGIFLRTYHFQSLLIFASDQARDLKIVEGVVNGHDSWPLLGPDMTGARHFRLGAIYYYFQIISANIFGVGATQQAYPDLFFSILSIPLFYYFLKRYFSENAALFSTAIYVFSYFAIEYSRFAWNVNLIPFFVLLYLFSLGEFLVKEEKTQWKWIAALGVSLGIGVQLHAILLLLFSVMTFFVFLFFILQKRKVWKKCIIVILIALSLNIGQFISEKETGFANTKTFFNAFIFKSYRTSGTVLKGLELDVACNAQADMHILSSLGNKDICNFLYSSYEISTTYNTEIKLERDPFSLSGKFASLLFSLIGLGFLLYYFIKAHGKQKYLWGLLILYGTLYFLIMIPIAPGSRLRYYLPIIFMPFVFLCFIYDFLAKKYPKKHFWITGIIFLFLLAANINSMRLKLENPACSKETQADFGCNLPITRQIPNYVEKN